MTLHFVHVGKTGGTAMRRALRGNGLAYGSMDEPGDAPVTPYGRIELHRHEFHLDDVPEGDFAFFCLRDPVSRFVSAFYSRLNKGQPRFYYEWSQAERRAFEAFPTPQRLAAALGSDDDEERRQARKAMRSIRHMEPMCRSVGTPMQLRAQRHKVVYVCRQETLGRDWEQLKALLGLPRRARLPRGPVRAHRRDPSLDVRLDAEAIETLRSWYRGDYRLLAYCDQLRQWNGWGIDEPPAGRFGRRVARLRAFPAVLPAPPAPLRRLGRLR